MSLNVNTIVIKKVCIMFPPKTRADVGMVQCVSKRHDKHPGGKTVRIRRRAGPCKEGGSWSTQKQVINTCFA